MRTLQSLTLLILLAAFTTFIYHWIPSSNPQSILRQAGETTQRARAIATDLIHNTEALKSNLAQAALSDEARQHALSLAIASLMLSEYTLTADHYNFATALSQTVSPLMKDCSQPLPYGKSVFDSAQEVVEFINEESKSIESLAGVQKLLSITAAQSALLKEMRQRGQYASDGDETPAKTARVREYIAKARLPLSAMGIVMERYANTPATLVSAGHSLAGGGLQVCGTSTILTAHAIEALLVCGDRLSACAPGVKKELLGLLSDRIPAIHNQFGVSEKQAYYFRTLTQAPELRESLLNVARITNELAKLGPPAP